MLMQENLSENVARNAFTFNDLNTHIDWNIVGPAMVVLFVVLCCLWANRDYIAYALNDNFVSRWRERRRMRADREKKLREILSDNIQDAVDLAFTDDEITAEERQWAFETIGKLGFPDLRSKAQTLKDEIKAKRAKEVTAQDSTLSTVHVL